jgi:uncharacterized protein (AIM24 family)
MSTAKFSTWLNPNGTENYKCRAWVNFNGTGTVAIRAAGNVASITDNGTGDYTINFTTAMSDANYSGSLTTGDASGTSLIAATNNFVAAPTSSAWRILLFTRAAGTITDSPFVFAAVFR